MESHPRISELLVETGAYQDLDKPVILTSGELGIYYIKTEKLVQDGGQFKEYGDDSRRMIMHAMRMMQKHPTFKGVIDILTEKARELLSGVGMTASVICGGQRRDWLFSGPVAKNLGAHHLSLYKQEKGEPDKIELLVNDFVLPPRKLQGYKGIHIADLLTVGSSCYRVEDDVEKGWIPMARSLKLDIGYYIAVVTRLQKGEEMLKGLGVEPHTYVAIDEEFLQQHSKQPERAIEYCKNRENIRPWNEAYLKENGALALLPFFDPGGKELDRAGKFLKLYGGFLKETGKMKELEQAVQDTYHKPLNEIVGGN